MKQAGLVSVTFRELSPEQIITLCVDTGLEAIEWGGDVHVPHGEVETARRVRALTEDAGLTVSSYGSYYRAGRTDGKPNPDASAVVDTALALGAPLIRIWVGDRSSEEVSPAQFEAAVRECRMMCELAAAQGMLVAAECHPNTLTDDYKSTLQLLDEVAHPAFKLYWQPNQFKGVDYDLHAIQAMRHHIVRVHTFFWTAIGERLPLQQGWSQWLNYRDAVGTTPDAFLLEFMPNNKPEELTEEAASLRKLLDDTMR